MDIQWNIENIDFVDGEKLDVVIVNLKLIYGDQNAERSVRSLICTIDEFYGIYKKFKDMVEAL